MLSQIIWPVVGWRVISWMFPSFRLNGDNVFRADLVAALLQPSSQNVSVAINRKDGFDADDMKVMLDGPRLTEIGKTLPVDTVDAEAIGFYRFNAEGAAHYVNELELCIA